MQGLEIDLIESQDDFFYISLECGLLTLSTTIKHIKLMKKSIRLKGTEL